MLRHALRATRPVRCKKMVNFLSENFRQEDLVNVGELGLSERARTSLAALGYTALYPVQAACWEVVGGVGEKVVVRANPGSGKTLAYVLPLVEKMMREPPAELKYPGGLVIVPTKELAYQVSEFFKTVGKLNVSALPVTGGSSVKTELDELRGGSVDVVVGTPGRLVDMLSRKNFLLTKISNVVIDEADIVVHSAAAELHEIFRLIPPTAKLFCFSATITNQLRNFSDNFFNPKKPTTYISLGPNTDKQLITPRVTHQHVEWPHFDKKPLAAYLVKEYLKTDPGGKVIIFLNKVDEAHRWAEAEIIKDLGPVRVMSSKVDPKKRQDTMTVFINGGVNIVVATDMLSRGVNVPGLNLVINIGIPPEVNAYVYRAGRTGRSPPTPGHCITITSPGDGPHVTMISRKAGVTLHPLTIPAPLARTLAAASQPVTTGSSVKSRYSSFGSRSSRSSGSRKVWGGKQ